MKRFRPSANDKLPVSSSTTVRNEQESKESSHNGCADVGFGAPATWDYRKRGSTIWPRLQRSISSASQTGSMRNLVPRHAAQHLPD
jgi:hypothetical protein